MSEHAPIASAEFVATLPDGSQRPLRVAVGVPYFGRLDVWWCPVWLDSLHPEVAAIAGEDALQALGLAWEYLGTTLTAFVAGGGRVQFPSGGDVPLTAYFGAAAGPRDPAT
jgi:hypothetical protein